MHIKQLYACRKHCGNCTWRMQLHAHQTIVCMQKALSELDIELLHVMHTMLYLACILLLNGMQYACNNVFYVCMHNPKSCIWKYTLHEL